MVRKYYGVLRNSNDRRGHPIGWGAGSSEIIVVQFGENWI